MSNAERFTKGGGVRVSDYPAPPVTLWGVIEAVLVRVPYWRVLAVAVWGVGLYCTVLTAALFIEGRAWQWVAAILAQATLTALQSPIWRRWGWDGKEEYKRPSSPSSWLALIIDLLLNITGTSAVVALAHKLPFVPAIVRLLSGEDAGPIAPLVGLPALLLAGVLAGLLAAAPEKLWWQE